MRLKLRMATPIVKYPHEGEIWSGPNGVYIVAGSGLQSRFVNLASGLFYYSGFLFGDTPSSEWAFLADGIEVEKE